MKIRNGFVSNSSSSSFVVVVKEEDHKAAIKVLPNIVREVLKKEFDWQKKTLFGQKIVFTAGVSNSEDFAYDFRLPEEYECLGADGFLALYEKELKKLGADYLMDNEGY